VPRLRLCSSAASTCAALLAAAAPLPFIAAAAKQLPVVDPGPVKVSSDPKLVPGFDRTAPDYAIHCNKSRPVALTFDASGTTKVSVNRGPARGGHFTSRVKLVPGRALQFSIDSGPDAGVFHVRCLPTNFPGYLATRYGKPQARWYVMSVGYIGIPRPDYTVVFDNHGVPVWWMREPHGLPFNGSYLPDGDIAWYRYTEGVFGINPKVGFSEHTLTGKHVRTYKARGGPTDLHELQILPNHHVMLIQYKPRAHVDLSRFGKSKDSTVVDGQIQEQTRYGKVVWTWNTKDHIPIADSARWLSFMDQAGLDDGTKVWDLVHLNTIDPHGSRIVISLRHADAVYEIDKQSGHVLWKLGGRHTSKSLRVVGDPLASESFGGQHDARLSSDGRFLTVFDNRSHRDHRPRAVLYEIDAAHRTATLLESITDPMAASSTCCGSARKLPGGDWVISWGATRWVTETDSTGKVLLRFDFHGRSAYRAYPVLPGVLDPARLRAGMDAMAH